MKVPATLFGTVFLGVLALAPSTAFADSPHHFLEKAMKGDNSEIMLGRLAERRAMSPAVRDYGRTLAQDHQMARADVLRVGFRYGVRGNHVAAPEAYDENRRLMHMRGRDFDREFVNYMVDDHHKDISDFRDEAREGHGPVSELARRQLPTLRKHLDMAMSLQRGGDRAAEGYGDRYDRHRYDR